MDQENVFKHVGDVPEGLTQQLPGYDGFGNPNRNRAYPSEWPFSEEPNSLASGSQPQE
jgi:hypothetical protein